MPKKIFELAKDLEMGPLDLVENLKTKGYEVRNHMTSLSDEDVESILAQFKKEEEEKAAAKTTTKKKVTRKKAAKKKVTKKASTAAKVETVKAKDETEETPVKKTTTRRKKTVIRRKTSDTPEKEEVLEAAETTPVETPTEETQIEAASTQQEEAVTESEETAGLRVISRPEAKKETEQAPEPKAEEKELYREKVHKFTPVFIPEKKEEEEERRPSGPAAQSGSSEDDDSDKKGRDSKKRLGGLASMMSGKKTGINRSQALTQARADSEMKSYAALSGSGRPVYSQVKKKKVYTGSTAQTEITEVKDSKRVIQLHKGGTAEEVAHKLSIKLADMINDCLSLNLLVKSSDYIGIKLASKIAALYNYRVEDKAFDEDKVIGKKKLSDEEKNALPARNPIITIMGHVDHGKTTLLDYIREAKVADGEAGGITQHIGAYSVKAGNKELTFLDTPGHAAFGSMRQRGANITDIVVLVVAADDGVMPQTKESIRYCQNADVPIIVAVNKMDKEGVNPDRIKQELTEFNITPEEWGGDTQMIPISALKGDGIDDLLEAIALQAEILELRADPKGSPEGVVIESRIEQGRGPVATVLVQKGTLKKGDSIVVGETYGRARSLTDSSGKDLKSAGPSIPVQILGLSEAPSPGDSLNKVKNEREAKKIVQNRVDERKTLASATKKETVSLEDFFASAGGDEVEQKTLNLIIRSDVQGSYEAIKQSLESLGNQEVEVRVIAGGVGPISDNDVNLASSAEGYIIGFNMRPVTSARRLSEQKGVDIKTYSIIYELINDIKLALEGLLEPEFVETYIGRAEVKDTFSVPKVGTIAGSGVIDGKIQVGCNVRLLRDGKIMFDGKMSSLKRFKDDVKEVKNGLECGIGLEGYNDIKVGDLFEAYMMVEKKRTLEEVEKAEALAAAKAAEMAEQEMSQEQL